MNFSISHHIIHEGIKKFQKGIAGVLAKTGRIQNLKICMYIIMWMIQGTHKRNFKIWKILTSFWFFEKTEFFAILAISKIHSGSIIEDLWQKMQQADHIYDLEERKNTFDISYINFEAKMNFSISHHIIHEGIKKMPKRYRRGVSKNWKDSEPENLHKVGDHDSPYPPQPPTS